MNRYSAIKKPDIAGKDLLQHADPLMRDLIKQLSDNLGKAMVVQDEKGSHVPQRFNTSTGAFEVYLEGAWRSLANGGSTAPIVVNNNQTVIRSSGTAVAVEKPKVTVSLDAPTNPSKDDLWVELETELVSFMAVNPSITINSIAPENPRVADIWLDGAVTMLVMGASLVPSVVEPTHANDLVWVPI